MQADKATVWIYAYVGDCDFNGPAFQLLIDDLVQRGASEALIKFHCYGGVVFDGNMIANTIENSPFPIDILIVGVCASMAAILMLKARKISIVSNGFVMIHTPSGFCDGNAEAHLSTAKLLQSMQGQFAIDLGTRTRKDATYTAKWLDGQDHWIDAGECLAEGLVDEIVPVATDAPEPLTVEAVATLGAKAVFNRFKASLEAPKPNNKKTMDKQRTIDKYNLTGVTADSTDEQVEAALEAHVKSITDSATKTADEVIDAMVEALGPDVTPTAKASYKAVGKSLGVATLKSIIGEHKPYAAITDVLKSFQAQPKDDTGTAGWDWDKYQKENPKALVALEKTDPATFKKLYTAKYGKTPGAEK
ncbi:ATP-dependent protease ClpP protease subunit [Mucilaginibacter gracilis]|uniref:ATP-dependent protease ClpP protease subunit n=2 Tax=Mucilaginibacter gracilis TaxID=423350 RepID=A0A495J2I5_9SPHI|nr:ATP-dependent protease ClpP protease subunit [Mucilaginibacter gracilis]